MNICKNIGIILVSLLIALVFSELLLRVFFPKYQYAADANYQEHSTLIWTRQANVHRNHEHPDTGKNHLVIYNNLASRQHRRITEKTIKNSTTLAFFGDSYTENLLMPVQYSFTEVLDYLLNNEKTEYSVLNLGVNGYGTDQAYISYSHKPYRKYINYVFYVFSGNDIRNIYENGLYDIDAENNLVREKPQNTPIWLKFVRRLYITYLLLEARAIFNHYLNHTDHNTDTEVHAKDIVRKWHDRYERSELRADQRKRRRTPEALAIQQQLRSGEIDAQTKKALRIFSAIVQEWSTLATESGSQFIVVFLPGEEHLLAQEHIPAHIPIIKLREPISDDTPRTTFINDAHWNEYGNMLAAMQIYFHMAKELQLKLNKKEKEQVGRLLGKYYAAFGELWQSPLRIDASNFKIEELNRIRETYLELENLEHIKQ